MSSQFRSDIIRLDNVSRKHGFMSFLALVDGTSQDLRALTLSRMQVFGSGMVMILIMIIVLFLM
jgi:hypothetical protein